MTVVWQVWGHRRTCSCCSTCLMHSGQHLAAAEPHLHSYQCLQHIFSHQKAAQCASNLPETSMHYCTGQGNTKFHDPVKGQILQTDINHGTTSRTVHLWLSAYLAESMNVRKLKQLCERLFKLPAQQQALSAIDPANGSIDVSLGHDDEAVLGSFNLPVRPFTRLFTMLH